MKKPPYALLDRVRDAILEHPDRKTLAEKAGLSLGFLSLIANGKRGPGGETLLNLCRALGIDPLDRPQRPGSKVFNDATFTDPGISHEAPSWSGNPDAEEIAGYAAMGEWGLVAELALRHLSERERKARDALKKFKAHQAKTGEHRK